MLRVHFRHMDPSEALTHNITDRIDALYSLARIMHCDVSVEAPPQHTTQAGPFAIRVNVRIPGKELVTRSENLDAYIAAHDAIENMRRRLEEYMSRRRVRRRAA